MKPTNMLSVAWDVWRAPKGGPNAIAARRQARLTELVAYARRHSPAYAEKYRGLPEEVTDLRQLPPATKPELMARFETWVTDPEVTRERVNAFIADKSRIGEAFLERYTVCTTSGTTGEPAVILYDEGMMNVVSALNLVRSVPSWLSRDVMRGMMRMGGRTAAVWATDGHFLGIGMAKRQIKQRPSRAERMQVFSVLTPIRELVAALNDYQPALLNGYATAVALLADEQVAGRLDIHPALVLTSSESLPPGERSRIAEVFGAEVRDNYGGSEFVAIAYDCGHGWLHVNADWVILEPVDDDYQPVTPGTPSRSALITNLANRVQPILRYELGDRILVNPEPCPCGSPLPAIRVEGRTDDVVRFEASDGTPVPVLPLALWSVLKETPGVQRFQAVQTAPDHLEVRLQPKQPEEREAVWSTLQERAEVYLASQGLGNVTVALSPEAPVRDPRSGKFRHVWSECEE
jgi:phenylacetate-coenzyme A ligase PaaK-like adenylate-forming protein